MKRLVTPSVEPTTSPKKSVVVPPDTEQAIWDLANQYLGSSYVSALAYSPDGQKLLFGTSEGSVKLWDLKTGEILNFEHEKAGVASVAFMSGGNNVLVRDLKDLIGVTSQQSTIVWMAGRRLRKLRVP